MIKGNPWVDRFDTTMTDREIVDRTTVYAVPPSGKLHARAPADAAAELRRRLEAVFIPSQQVVAIVRNLLGKARAHATHSYPDLRGYLRGVNASRCPLQEVPAVCVTGLAGCGKTEIAKSLLRLLDLGPTVDPGSGYPSVTLEAAWHVAVKEERSLRSLLQELMRGRSANSDADLCKLAGRLGFRQGVALLIADELQFWTLSTNANAAITSLLYRLRYIGLPLIFIGNFSLCHRLLKRPQEDQHRLLGEAIIVMPDTLDDPSLSQLYEQYRIASGGALCSEPDVHAEQIEHFSAGVKRSRKELLVLSYRIARERGRIEVRSSDLDAAYVAPEFSIYRRDAETLRRQALVDDGSQRERRGRPAAGQGGRSDLWCPLDLPLSEFEVRTLRAREQEEELIARQALLASMTATERAGLEEVKRQQDSKRNPVSPTLARRPRLSASTLESLQAGTERFVEQESKARKVTR